MTMFSQIIALCRRMRIVALVLVTAPALAQTPFSTDPDAPTIIEAGRMLWQQASGRMVLRDGAQLTQGPMTLSAEAMEIVSTAPGDTTPEKLTANGKVVLRSDNGRVARGDKAVYVFSREILTMTGNVETQDTRPDARAQKLSGAALTVNMRDGTLRLSGDGKGGRARIELRPDK